MTCFLIVFCVFSSAHPSSRLPASLFAVLEKHVCCWCYQMKTSENFRKRNFFNELHSLPSKRKTLGIMIAIEQRKSQVGFDKAHVRHAWPLWRSRVCPLWSLALLCFHSRQSQEDISYQFIKEKWRDQWDGNYSTAKYGWNKFTSSGKWCQPLNSGGKTRQAINVQNRLLRDSWALHSTEVLENHRKIFTTHFLKVPEGADDKIMT